MMKCNLFSDLCLIASCGFRKCEHVDSIAYFRLMDDPWLHVSTSLIARPFAACGQPIRRGARRRSLPNSQNLGSKLRNRQSKNTGLLNANHHRRHGERFSINISRIWRRSIFSWPQRWRFVCCLCWLFSLGHTGEDDQRFRFKLITLAS